MSRGNKQLKALILAVNERLNEQRNHDKGSWKNYHPVFVLWLLTVELFELSVELLSYFFRDGDKDDIRIRIRHEIADCVVFLMILGDVLGVWKIDIQ